MNLAISPIAPSKVIAQAKAIVARKKLIHEKPTYIPVNFENMSMLYLRETPYASKMFFPEGRVKFDPQEFDKFWQKMVPPRR